MHMFSASSEHFPELLKAQLLPRENFVRILMVGDVVGKPGRQILKQSLSLLRPCLELDFVTINGENLAGGFGITSKIFDELMSANIDAVTMGNHWADKPDVHQIRAAHKNLVLPQNLLDVTAVNQIPEFNLQRTGQTISILNLMGQFAMKDSYADPFAFVEKNIAVLRSKKQSGQNILIADVHAEASSEKQAIAKFLDGILAGFIGTHTHTPTSDERLSAGGTAFITDVGMTGPYNSIIGMDTEKSLRRYFGRKEKKPQEVAAGQEWFCGFLLEVGIKTGLTAQAHRIQYRSEHGTWLCSTVQN